jgi:hypothetical protein
MHTTLSTPLTRRQSRKARASSLSCPPRTTIPVPYVREQVVSVAREQVHGTAIASAGRAVLLRGASGSGKSDLALRCIGLPRSDLLSAPFRLVADDRVELEAGEDSIYVCAPSAISGLIEVRGLGIVELPAPAEWPILALIIDLTPGVPIERLPALAADVPVLGRPIRRITLDPFEFSAPLKVALALAGSLRIA